MGRQRYCPPAGAQWRAWRVSADPVAKPAAQTRAEKRGSRPFKSGCGRETDCLLEGDGFELPVPRKRDSISSLYSARETEDRELAGSPVAESGLASPGPPQKRAVRAKAPRSCAAAACQLRRGRGKRRGFHSCVVATSRKAEQRSAGATSPNAAIRSGACGKFSLMGKHRFIELS
jgi:hypothetical protein